MKVVVELVIREIGGAEGILLYTTRCCADGDKRPCHDAAQLLQRIRPINVRSHFLKILRVMF